MKSTIKRIFKYVKPYRLLFVFGIICAALQTVCTLVAPIITGRAIDGIIEAGRVDFEGILHCSIALGLTVLAASMFQWLMNYCIGKMTYAAVGDLRKDAFAKLMNVPLSYIDGNPHGDITTRIVTDIENIGEGLLQTVNQLLVGIVTVVGTVFFMLRLNVRVALIVMLITPLSIFVAVFITRRIHKYFNRTAEVRGDLGGYFSEISASGDIIEAFCAKEERYEGFCRLNDSLQRVNFKSQLFSALTNPSTRLVNNLVYAAVGVFGALAITGEFGAASLTIGGLSCFLSYANQYTKPFNEITAVFGELQTAVSSASRVFELLDSESEEDSPLSLPDNTAADVTFDSVSFSYNPERPLIENFDLSVKSGQRVAIVGPTGCGKTTLINLLMRFYDVNGGSIMLGGTDIKEVSRKSLRNQFGMVLQETWLFGGTVYQNIAFGSPNASKDDIIAAAKAVHADRFIRQLPNGYDTVIGENDNISIGQKQLLCIARIMLRSPKILILDEATSNIDTRTELYISRAFRKISEGKTSFVVAHRLDTIKNSDVILVMRDGNIVERGTHTELMKAGGFYFGLYQSRFADGPTAD